MTKTDKYTCFGILLALMLVAAYGRHWTNRMIERDNKVTAGLIKAAVESERLRVIRNSIPPKGLTP